MMEKLIGRMTLIFEIVVVLEMPVKSELLAMTKNMAINKMPITMVVIINADENTVRISTEKSCVNNAKIEAVR